MLGKKGLVELSEECGELIQICCKKMTRMETDRHWDSAVFISERLQNEIADVHAATAIVVENFGLDDEIIKRRAEEKLKLFRQWSAQKDD